MRPSDTTYVDTTRRMLALLHYVGQHPGTRMAAIVVATGIPRATAYRFLSMLRHAYGAHVVSVDGAYTVTDWGMLRAHVVAQVVEALGQGVSPVHVRQVAARE